MKKVRIGAGQGFWGDSPFPALDGVQSGNIKYLAGDGLAELTLSILLKARQKESIKGFVENMFFSLLLQPCRDRGIKILTNQGGINPAGASQIVYNLARKKKRGNLKNGI